VDTYQKPVVRFENHNIGDYILMGGLIGFVIGGVALLSNLAIGLVSAQIGGVIGALLGATLANKKIESLPVKTVTITVKEPVYEVKEIGKIPQDKIVKLDVEKKNSSWRS